VTAPPDESPPARTGRDARWLRTATDRVPTAWIPGILTAVFLGVAAAFGGLEAVAGPSVATLEPGETHTNDAFDLTVERAVLIDTFPEAGASADPEEGERVLAVVVTVENRWDRAVAARADTAVRGSLVAPGLDDPVPWAVARFDDGTGDPWLQPGLPVQVVVTWVIGGDELAAGDDLELEIRDFSLQRGQIVFSGEVWSTPIVAARMALPLTDVGAGADAEESE
jgi:hypothetical protein